MRARIRARDVSLALRKPDRHQHPQRPARHGARDPTRNGPIVDVQLAVGAPTISARITRRSLHELGIRTGQEVYALVKAVSFDQRSVGYA